MSCSAPLCDIAGRALTPHICVARLPDLFDQRQTRPRVRRAGDGEGGLTLPLPDSAFGNRSAPDA